ncbi:MAG: redoxin domain-containing protein [Proteobacteria bacterium]|nr:redoxin domain-containing protein [Pseudomonadota bacterium]
MQVRDHAEELTGRGARVLVVSFANVSQLADFQEYLKLPFEISSDPEHKAYQDYGLLDASFSTIWHPKVALKYAALMLKGRRPKFAPKSEDLSQLGGDFVIDSDGQIVYAFISQRADHRPDVSELVSAVDDLFDME